MPVAMTTNRLMYICIDAAVVTVGQVKPRLCIYFAKGANGCQPTAIVSMTVLLMLFFFYCQPLHLRPSVLDWHLIIDSETTSTRACFKLTHKILLKELLRLGSQTAQVPKKFWNTDNHKSIFQTDVSR